MTISEDLQALELFNEKAEILRKSPFKKFLLEAKIGFTITFDKPIRTETRSPDEVAIGHFILTFRFFIQDNERCSIRKVAEIYDRLPISQQKKDLYKNPRSSLNKFLDSESPVKVDDETITRRCILKMFIYGDLSHVKRKYKKLLDQWMSDPVIGVVVYNQFILILLVVMDFIEYASNLNKEVIKELSEKK